MPKPPRLIVVANRLPINRVGSGPSARWVESGGGLVTALVPMCRAQRGAWVGWTGAATSRGAAVRPFTHEGIGIRPVTLSEAEVDGFYHQMSNRTFWPLYHDAIRTPDFDHRWWRPYFEVNRRYARAAASVAGKGDLVWVHDYHLQLVPGMIRELRPDVKIGFFLHIPFPPEELFAWLPWREKILRGLLGADVVGFQTHASALNFVRAARQFAGAEGPEEQLEFEGRAVHVGSYPISIDTPWFEAQAAEAETVREAATIRRRIGGNRKLILCVDRLDYTKGIDTRLRAFELLLERGRFTARDCVLMQVAVPSREPVFEYAEMRTRIEQIVGRINGEYSEPGRVAVHYFRRSLARKELVAYYRAADIMVVTPLRDGMNLVAKEFVATRLDGSGVLVLSEFAGAARELRRALLVNPRDIEGVASAMEQALSMPRSDARQRMSILRMIVRRHDVAVWAESFLESLRR
ncbi:MAG: trehalose-6-phosphate synthase [Phycisphaeraceae bacterium]|nr:trehalose-6-phosphate synthase [Phycisphaeraceae bacterium]